MKATRRESFGIGIGALATVSGLAGPAASHAASSNLNAGQTAGWRSLFNGRDLTGWKTWLEGSGYEDLVHAVDIHDGILHFLGPRYKQGSTTGMGYIVTDDEFSNYHLSLDYKWGTRRYAPRQVFKRDSGLLYHTRPGRDFLWPDSIEFQIIEKGTGDAFPINHRAVAGISAGGVPSWPRNPPGLPFAPQINAGGNLRQAIKADGDFENMDGWNTVELIAEGNKAAHIVNGRIVNTLFEMEAQIDGDRSRYARLDKGRILLQLECAEVMFRNIRIRPL